MATTPTTPCQGDHELFFSADEGEQGQAIGLCRGCPRRQACLYDGIRLHDRHGPNVWGGVLFPVEQQALRRLAARSVPPAAGGGAVPGVRSA